MKNTQKGARYICQPRVTSVRACFRSIFAAGCPILSPTQSKITVSINFTSVEDTAKHLTTHPKQQKHKEIGPKPSRT
jgi:hypothetical protein